MDEDNDGRFPDDSPVQVRYPRNRQEELADRGVFRDASEIRLVTDGEEQ